MAKLFKTSLFGYKKKSVYDYIERMNEEFSPKLLLQKKKDEDIVRKLEAQLEQQRRENEQLRSLQQEVATVLAEAKVHAARLIAKAEKEAQVIRAQNRAHCAAERQRIQKITGSVDVLREDFCKTLHDMEADLEGYSIKGEALEKSLEPDKSALLKAQQVKTQKAGVVSV